MALNAITRGSSLHLQWNRDSPLIRGALRGVLWIGDGSQRRQIDLKAEDLKQGSIQYWPSSSDVDFKLEVLRPSGGASESIRALSIPLPALMETHARVPAPVRTVPAPFATVDFEVPRGRKQVTTPQPLYRVIPADRADLRSRLKRRVAVDVRVDIDAAGKVKRAELVSKHSDAQREFESLALGASRGWTFTPARNGARRVPSQAVLHYHFESPPAMAAELR
jgi:TonB family protein